MDDKLKYGGPAFPAEWETREVVEMVDGNGKSESHDMVSYHKQTGMSLRDYFAAKVMHALISNPNGPQSNAFMSNPDSRDLRDWMATDAYAYADAMLAEREK